MRTLILLAFLATACTLAIPGCGGGASDDTPGPGLAEALKKGNLPPPQLPGMDKASIDAAKEKADMK